MPTSYAKRCGFSLIELLVVIAIIAILTSLLMAAIQRAREAAMRTCCMNNLHQLALALYVYHDANNGFPPQVQTIAPNVSHSWESLILPEVEQAALSEQYHFDKDWTDPANDSGLNQTVIRMFNCPSAPPAPPRTAANNRGVQDYPAVCSFLAPNPFVTNLPPLDPTFNGVLGNNVSRNVSEIQDGTSNTILLAECAGRNQCWEMGKQTMSGPAVGGAWANPGNYILITGYDPATNSTPGPIAVNGTNGQNIYSFHPGVAGALFADGSVRYMRSSIKLDILIALATRSGGELVPDGDY